MKCPECGNKCSELSLYFGCDLCLMLYNLISSNVSKELIKLITGVNTPDYKKQDLQKAFDEIKEILS